MCNFKDCSQPLYTNKLDSLILGYSMAVAKTRLGTLTIVGAPRYQHRGVVISVYENSLDQTIDPFAWQVCAHN